MISLAELDWSNLNEGVVVPAIVFGTGMIIAVTAIIANHWRKARQAESEAQLKALMLQRGMSASDIERVMRAGHGPDKEALSSK